MSLAHRDRPFYCHNIQSHLQKIGAHCFGLEIIFRYRQRRACQYSWCGDDSAYQCHYYSYTGLSLRTKPEEAKRSERSELRYGQWVLTTTRSWEYGMRLKTIANTTNGATVCSHAYLYDAMQRRTQATLEDASMWKYTYNDRNELVSAGRFWSDWAPVTGQQFEYAFDDIGNRTSAASGGDAAGAALRSATYSANTVNQLTQRDVPGAVDIIGAATATATSVTVNSQSSYRRGEYYQVPLAINNASSAQWTSVSNLAVQSGTTNTVIGNT